MKLYHFTDTDVTELRPEFFGQNTFTRNDARYSPARIFFYKERGAKESFFNHARFMYTVRIPDTKIYDLAKDRLKLKTRFQNITALLFYCKCHYYGVSYNIGFDVVCSFYPVKPVRKDVLK